MTVDFIQHVLDLVMDRLQSVKKSQLVRPFQPTFAKYNPLELLNVVDCGDADTTPSIIEDSFKEIEAAAHEIFVAEAAALAFGGDGNINLLLLRAAHKFYPNLVVLHVDAHTYTYCSDGNQDHSRYNVATTFTRAAEEGLIDTNEPLHIGPCRPTMDSSVFENTRDVGFQLIDGDDLFETDLLKTADNLVEQLKDRTVYFCFNMDFLDPSCAPGVCTPT